MSFYSGIILDIDWFYTFFFNTVVGVNKPLVCKIISISFYVLAT